MRHNAHTGPGRVAEWLTRRCKMTRTKCDRPGSNPAGAMRRDLGQVSNLQCASVHPAVQLGTWWNDKLAKIVNTGASAAENALHSPQGDETVYVCVPIPGGKLVKSLSTSGWILTINHLYLYLY